MGGFFTSRRRRLDGQQLLYNSDQPQLSRWRRSLASLERPQFRWLLASNAAFFLAMQGQVLTRTFLAWELTGEEMALAYINVAFAIPMLLFSLLGGALSDRVERRRLVVIGQCILLVNEATVLALLWQGQLAFWHLLATGAVGGAVLPLIMPARNAIVYNVVGTERLGNAMALSGGVINLSRVLGPAMMGGAISLYSASGAYSIATLLFLLSLACMVKVHPRPIADRQGEPQRIRQDIVQGFTYVITHRALLVCLAFGLLPMLLAMPFQNLLVLFADQVWQVGERGLGLLMGLSGLGGVLGSVWVAQRGESHHRTPLMIASTLLFGVLLMAFSLTENFYLALIPLILANACASAGQTLNNTSAQLLVDDTHRGRMSAFMLMSFGLTPLGVLPLAYLAQHIGAPWTTFFACALLLLTVAVFYQLSPTLRKLDRAVSHAVETSRPADDIDTNRH